MMKISTIEETEAKISKMTVEEIIKTMKETKYEVNDNNKKYMTNLYLMLREFIRYKCTHCMYYYKNSCNSHFCRKNNYLDDGNLIYTIDGCDDFINNQSLDALSRKAGMIRYRY